MSEWLVFRVLNLKGDHIMTIEIQNVPFSDENKFYQMELYDKLVHYFLVNGYKRIHFVDFKNMLVCFIQQNKNSKRKTE